MLMWLFIHALNSNLVTLISVKQEADRYWSSEPIVLHYQRMLIIVNSSVRKVRSRSYSNKCIISYYGSTKYFSSALLTGNQSSTLHMNLANV